MALLPLIYAPHPIFKQKSLPVETIDAEIWRLIDDMFETMEYEKAVGMAANMVGVLKQIAIVDLLEDGVSKPYTFINPEIIWCSDETQTHEEASICFVGVSAKVTRPHAIKMRYLDRDAMPQELEASGFLACVIQHEIDYMNGITFPDYLSKMKRDMLFKKMHKHLKIYPPHVHGAGCNHG